MTPRTHIAALLCAGILAAHATADTFMVNGSGRGDFTTIQEAVDAAQSGDEIIIAPGTYTQSASQVIYLNQKSLSIRSSEGPEVTVIDAEGARRCIAISSSPGVHFSGLSFVNGSSYKDSGGGYEGKKPSAKSNKMKKWTKEDWGTKSGKNSTEGKGATGERYLPKKKRDAMSDKDYKRTSDKKRRDTAKGKQWSKQPD